MWSGQKNFCAAQSKERAECSLLSDFAGGSKVNEAAEDLSSKLEWVGWVGRDGEQGGLGGRSPPN